MNHAHHVGVKSVIALSMSLILSFSSEAQINRFTGNQWKQLVHQLDKAESSYLSQSDSAALLMIKKAFLGGFLVALTETEIDVKDFVTTWLPIWGFSDGLVLQIKKQLAPPINLKYLSIDVQYYVFLLDWLYSDSRNLDIGLVSALDICFKKFNGMDVDWDIQFQRADKETREKMAKQKYPQLQKR